MQSIEKKFSQENLTPINSSFFNYLKKTEFDGKKLTDSITDIGKNYCSTMRSHHLQALPTFISKETYQELESAIVSVTDLLKTAAKRLQYYDEFTLRNFHKIEKNDFEKNYKSTIHEIEKTTGRMDFLLTENGLKCLEFNVGISCGGWENEPIFNAYKSNGLINSFCKEKNIKLKARNTLLFYIDFYIQEAFNRIQDIHNEFNFLVWYNPLIYYDGISLLYYKLLRKMNLYQIRSEEIQMNEYHNAFLNSSVLKDKKDIKRNFIVTDDLKKLKVINKKLYYNEKRIHVVLPFMGFPFSEIEKSIEKDSVIITEHPSNRLLAKKLYFATLSENHDSSVFSKEEQGIIRKYIPWTRRVFPVKTDFHGKVVDLDKFCKENKDTFVIKENNSFGGHGVYVGKDLTQEKWEEILEKALNSNQYIVQEYVESLMYNYLDKDYKLSAHRVGWGAFIIGDKFGGGFARPQPESSSSKINVSQGSTISFLIEGEVV